MKDILILKIFLKMSPILIMIITTQTFWHVLPLKGNADITNRYYMYEGLTDTLGTYLENNPEINFLKESLTFPSEELPISQLMLSILGSFAEFERALIKERQREGIEIAKRK